MLQTDYKVQIKFIHDNTINVNRLKISSSRSNGYIVTFLNKLAPEEVVNYEGLTSAKTQNINN